MKIKKFAVQVLILSVVSVILACKDKIIDPSETFSGITITNETGQVLGGDITDWCYGVSSISKPVDLLPTEFGFSPAYPNPCNGLTSLTIVIPVATTVRVTAFSEPNKEIVELVNQALQAGVYTVSWNLTNNLGVELPDGIYRVVMKAADFECYGDVQILHP